MEIAFSKIWHFYWRMLQSQYTALIKWIMGSVYEDRIQFVNL
jgi:hypothetical protein